jgi:hypothetical protein
VSQLLPIPQIVAMLASRIDQLARELLPAGKQAGTEWRCGSVAGEPGQSLAVHLRGEKAGVWCDFSTSDPRHRGDALDLVAMVLFGGDKVEALRWSRAWLGLDRGGSFATRQAAAPAVKQRAERDEDGKRVSALKMWLDAKPIAGSPAAAYLAGRGLPLEHLGRAPGALRFAPECWCAEAQMRLPAMLGAITREGEHIATHRTWLMQERGVWRKARLQAAKKVLGSFQGGVIPIWRGAAGRPLREVTAEETVAIGEGIEDALTVAWHCRDWRVLAAVTLGNVTAVRLPEKAADIVLVFDRDGENRQAAIARQQAVEALLRQGRSVRETRPPEGFKDMNEWHQSLPVAQRESAA